MSAADWEQIALALACGEAVDGWQRVTISRQAAVYYNPRDNHYLKLFYPVKWRQALRDMIYPAGARHRRFIRQCALLRERNLPAPAVIAGGELMKTGFVVSEGFRGLGFGTFAANFLRPSPGDRALRQWKRHAMAELGKAVARLHNAGVCHGDLRPDNILLSCESVAPRFCFIDNERNHLYRDRVPLRALIKNLSQLNMIWPEDWKLSDRARFFLAYFAHSTSLPEPPKRIVHRVIRLTRKRLAGKAKGGYQLRDNSPALLPDFDKLLREYHQP